MQGGSEPDVAINVPICSQWADVALKAPISIGHVLPPCRLAVLLLLGGKVQDFYPIFATKTNALHICNHFENACVITQNVDGLHTKHSGKIKDDQLIEVHGSMHGGYKCIHSTCQSVERCIEENEIDLTACGNGFVPGEPDFKLEKCPTCPECSHPLLPQCLLFDEEYSSHPFYEWNAASDWMEDACAMVFVGTSFSVGLSFVYRCGSFFKFSTC